MRVFGSSLLSSESAWVCSSCRDDLLRRAIQTASLPRARRPSRNTKPSQLHKTSHLRRQQRWISSTTPRKAAPTRTAKLPGGPARTRFAPSPTGYLHIGGLRTALFSYLLAKRTGGQFILRIEDTDQKRLVQDAELKLFDNLRWAGLQWDEGPETDGPYGPYKQSLRNDIYHRHALELLQTGQAYRCFCTPQTAGEAKAAYVTSGCYQNCSSLSREQSGEKATDLQQFFTVRLRQPPNAHKRTYPDLIYGNIQRLKRSPSAPLTASEDDTAVDASDTILVKSDGTPTYHFANVVDDHLMGITHVIRGSEWMASTPLHYDIYSASNWKPPQFAHVGLLVDQNKAKLSKRNADLALDVASMRDKHGVLPAPLINFLALLGWSNPTSNDVMELDDLVRNFDLKFTRGNAMVKMEKLWFLQKAHVAKQCQRAREWGDFEVIQPLVEQITAQVKATYSKPLVNRKLPHYDDDDISPNFDTTATATDIKHPDSISPATLGRYIRAILLTDGKSYQNASQFVERNRYLFTYNPTDVPVEQTYYNKAQTLTGNHLYELAQRVLNQNWFTLDDQVGLAPLERQEFGVSIALALEAWKLALNSKSHPVLCSPLEEVEVERSGEDEMASAIERVREALGDHAAQPEDVAKRVVGGLEKSDAAIQVLVKRYKAVNGGLMKYLREKLSLGLPGPHMSAVMAILGKEECVRRLRDRGRKQ